MPRYIFKRSFTSSVSYFYLYFCNHDLYVSLLGSAVCRARLSCLSSRESSDLVELFVCVVGVCRYFSLCCCYMQASLDVSTTTLGSVHHIVKYTLHRVTVLTAIFPSEPGLAVVY